MAKNDGGPAFPTGDREEYRESEVRTESYQHPDFHGMSLRDYFAGQVLASLFRNASARQSCPRCGKPRNGAKMAYWVADAMLKMREAEDE